MGVGDRHVVAADVQDPPRRIAEQKDVARLAFDGEVFIEGADDRLLRLGDDAVRGDLGNRPAVGDGGDSGHGPGTDASADPVVMQIHLAAAG